MLYHIHLPKLFISLPYMLFMEAITCKKELADSNTDTADNKHQKNPNGEDQVQVHVSTSLYLYNLYSVTPDKKFFFF